ncbi:MAG: DUF4374 domain-containing protein [Mediterranea sp.]|jgi:hypothetical protein|nr:DUF4374 domain-containing protein [Mediterranea sp.]
MKKFYFKSVFATAVLLGSTLTSCENDSPFPSNPSNKQGQYIISATAGGANYLLQAESLDEGSVTAVGGGMETPTGTMWHFYEDKYLYRLQYNQGNAGVTSSYQLNANGAIEARDSEYNITRFTTYATVDNYVMTVSAADTDKKDDAGNVAKGLGITYLHATNEITSNATLPCENFLGNGEYVSLAGIVEANNLVYTSVIPMGLSRYGVQSDGGKWVTNPDLITQEDGGTGSGAYGTGVVPGTQYPDYAWVAIYPNEQFAILNPTIIKSDKIGYACGRNRSQYLQTIWAADNGDVYLFSPGYGRLTSNKYQTPGKLPSGVVRIKKGAKEFDADYYVNLEELTGGQPLYRCWHMTGDYFLLQMYTNGLNGTGIATTKLAVFKGEDKTLRYVTELPEPALITSFANEPYNEKGVSYMPVVTNDGNQPALYRIDPVTATATKGLTVTADGVSAVGRLTIQ